MSFEKERAKWEQEKSFLQNQKDDAIDAMQRLEKKVENLLRENEKLKNDVKNSRKNYAGIGAGVGGYGAGAGLGQPVNFHAAMVGKQVAEKYGGGVNKSTVLGAGFSAGIGNLLGKPDGSGTDRSTYHYPTAPYGTAGGAQPPREDKSFVSPNGASSGVTHGAVGALNLAGAGLTGGNQPIITTTTPVNGNMMFDMKNILNTPSSGKSKSGISQEDALELQKP